ncbi:MAG: hypothetical protein IJE98_03965, partial [Oscillospiraceae bacterium]|nr:hypothetical protein [Oscillospiraceae bacterium]
MARTPRSNTSGDAPTGNAEHLRFAQRLHRAYRTCHGRLETGAGALIKQQQPRPRTGLFLFDRFYTTGGSPVTRKGIREDALFAVTLSDIGETQSNLRSLLPKVIISSEQLRQQQPEKQRPEQ